MALGSLYVQQYFTDHSKRAVSLLWKLFQNFSFVVTFNNPQTKEMISHLKQSFLHLLDQNEWMDPDTKRTARTKVRKVRKECTFKHRHVSSDFTSFSKKVSFSLGTTYEREDRISRLYFESNGTFARVPYPGIISVFLTFSPSSPSLSLSVLFLSLLNFEMFGFKLEINE